jgi:D-serine deaminase-like pyridoxal phosphate-dependent protein
MAYEGHLLTLPDLEEKRAAVHAALGKLVRTKEIFEQSGIACPVVSCGGTGCYDITVAYPGVTELQAGGAILMDAFYRQQCHITSLQYALTCVATVVSRPAADRAVIDAGRKTLSKEIQMPLVAGRGDIQVTRLSAEHGDLHLDPSARNLKIGDRLELIPGYADLTVNLHDEIYGFRHDRLEVIFPIAARGKVQ